MASVNKAILVGRLGKDPAAIKGGAQFAIATDERWTDKSGNKQVRTEWHQCSAFGRLGEIALEYLRKGRQVYVEGRLRTSEYADRDGVVRRGTSIIVDELQMLGDRDRAERSPGDLAPGFTEARSTGPVDERVAPARDDPFFNDDIPF